MAVRVVLIDDNDDFRRTASALLASHGFEVVAEAADHRAALTAVRRSSPDLVLVDVELGPDDGVALAQELAGFDAAPAVILMSARPAWELEERISTSCALGFVGKSMLTGPALRRLLTGSD